MNLKGYLEKNMIQIPSGEELLRDFIDPVKWISSNYKMSAPGTNKGKIIEEKKVEIKPFSLLSVPVTNELYNFVMKTEYDKTYKDYPVTNINWLEAVVFCNTLSELCNLEKVYVLSDTSVETKCNDSKNGFRLPTDGEWQYACRANSKGYRYGNIDEIAWYRDNSRDECQKAGMKKENAFGLFDMIGNVWEWCFDIYDQDRYGDYRIFRGGSFASEERACGATSRRKTFPEYRIDDLGVRIARTY